MDHKYEVGNRFRTPDGEAEVIDTFTRELGDNVELFYELKYLDQVGKPVTPEKESVVDDYDQVL